MAPAETIKKALPDDYATRSDMAAAVLEEEERKKQAAIENLK